MKLQVLSLGLLTWLQCSSNVVAHSHSENTEEEGKVWTQDDAEELERKWGFDVSIVCLWLWLFGFALFFVSCSGLALSLALALALASA